MVRRAYVTLNEKNFISLYQLLVRSHLDYAVSVWSPYKEKKEVLESVQRACTKQIPRLRDLPYSERLKKLKLPTLVYCRTRSDMIKCYKILNSIYNTKVENFRLSESIQNRPYTRGHHLKLFYRRPCTNQGKFSFTNRVVELWNSLPQSIVESCNTDTFKNRLDRYWSNQDLLYNYKAKIETKSARCNPKLLHAQDLTIEATDGN